MNKVFIALFLTIWIIGCGPTRSIVKPRDPYIQLRRDLDNLLSDSLFLPSHASVKIISLNNEKLLYNRESNALMNPASNMKLFTSAAALFILDTNYQFRTNIAINSTPVGGIVNGNIYLKGYGDPLLTTQHLDSMARSIGLSGITRVCGNIIIDDSYFDDSYWGAGWTWDDESDPDAPYINALSVNGNCVSILVLSDSISTFASTESSSNYFTIVNKAKVVNDSIRNPLIIRRLNTNNTNTFIIEGELFPYDSFSQKFSVRYPQYYAGNLLKEALQRNGIQVDGNIISGSTPLIVQEIASNRTPLSLVLMKLNKESDNLCAENIIKILGISGYGLPGSTKAGIYVVKKFLSSIGLDTTQLSIADGSGVSRYNLMSAQQIVYLLKFVHKHPRIFPMLYESLPIAGADGTLSGRMLNYPAANNLRAKTGTLNGVSCLSGYVQTRDGEMLAFSIMMQNFIESVSLYRKIKDKIGIYLSNFSTKSAKRTNK